MHRAVAPAGWISQTREPSSSGAGRRRGAWPSRGLSSWRRAGWSPLPDSFLAALNNQFGLTVFFVGFVAAGISIVSLTVIAQRHYRCPGCGAMPRTHRGVPLDPWECPACGEPLK